MFTQLESLTSTIFTESCKNQNTIRLTKGIKMNDKKSTKKEMVSNGGPLSNFSTYYQSNVCLKTSTPFAIRLQWPIEPLAYLVYLLCLSFVTKLFYHVLSIYPIQFSILESALKSAGTERTTSAGCLWLPTPPSTWNKNYAKQFKMDGLGCSCCGGQKFDWRTKTCSW